MFLSSYVRVFDRVERILGEELLPGRAYRGVSLQGFDVWQRIGGSSNWPALRVLSVDTMQRQGAMVPSILLRSPLGRRLAHLDLTVHPTNIDSLDPHVLFRELALTPALQRLSVLATFGSLEPITLAFERNRGGVFELTLQIPPYGPDGLEAAFPWIDRLGRGVDRISVGYVRVSGQHHDLEAERGFVARLRRRFHEVTVAEELQPPICPWAYPGYSTLLPSTPMP